MGYAKLTLVGLALFGARTIETTIMFIAGNYERELRAIAYNVVKKSTASCEEDLELPEVVDAAERIKARLQYEIQELIDTSVKHEASEARETRLRALREMHSPSAHGTVAEICAKYGQSKAAVRRMRAEGSLANFIAAQKMTTE